MTDKLFSDSEVFQKDRPTHPTPAQEQAFYTKMAKELKEEGFSRSSIEAIAEDLKDLAPFNDNGFELAKQLEGYRANAYYEIDTRFCEWLDGLSYEYDQVNEQNIKAWVAAHNPQPKFNKGAKLSLIKTMNHLLKEDSVVYVTGVKMDKAVYYISQNKDENGGFVIAFEKVEECSIELL
jgi:hypothetical protein